MQTNMKLLAGLTVVLIFTASILPIAISSIYDNDLEEGFLNVGSYNLEKGESTTVDGVDITISDIIDNSTAVISFSYDGDTQNETVNEGDVVEYSYDDQQIKVTVGEITK